MKRNSLILLAGCGVTALLASCTGKVEVEPVSPDYARQLSPGESALRRINNPARLPDLSAAYDKYWSYDSFMLDALDKSAMWFQAPSSKHFYPFDIDNDSITHQRAVASLASFRELLESSRSSEQFRLGVLEKFDIYESVGYNGQGTVLYTGYYSPVFSASKTKTSTHSVPLYTRPVDLVTEEVTGRPLGRKTTSGETVSYYTRREIEESNMFAGNELVWLKDELSAYIVHVNGSAKLRLTDGSVMHIGYAGKTDKPYYGLGKSMLEEGYISPNNLSLTTIKDYFRKHPQRVIDLIYRNENYVFFTEYDPENWPSGSLGVPVTEETTLATDKKIYPRGGVVLVDTQAVTLSFDKKRFLHFMMDQDTGGAIQAPGRADIFMGTGELAEILAGGQYAEGRLYYFFLKQEYVESVLADASD